MNKITNQMISSQSQNSNNLQQTISSRPQNNHRQLQRPNNIVSPQNTGGLFQRAPNTSLQPIIPQNITNQSINTSIDVQLYTDIVGGMDLSPGMQDVENPPTEGAQSSTLLISGYLFP
ncbi:45458_t:CDS:1 [Gigaspora margarita]|uniref:45458_t:CDS:1 n=1 Tax=Gigaspora margarita TaxID=4874 RepID=A0ABN7VMG3_GIGMA|nr:45458_t:CDS:1 [Gigaspora margarita]